MLCQTRSPDWNLTNNEDAALGPFSRVTRTAEQSIFLIPAQTLGMRSHVCLWGLHGFFGWLGFVGSFSLVWFCQR